MPKAEKVSILDKINSTIFFPNRKPDTPPEEMNETFCTLSEYRNGGIYAGQYAGNSEWERHPHGDEIVMVVDGMANLILLIDGHEKRIKLNKLEFAVVPENTWHRFEVPEGVKIMVVTPQPTDHQIEKPIS
ncbi:cupin domain-containing protein [Halobacteriovorax sp. GFR7]|uniref:cupin domain-containing protein n=1 Tax=unclassified Halobacteriovorax TaxID=2639665 RepID=UPI003D98838D